MRNPVYKKVGFKKIRWNKRSLQMPDGMEIDFGGIVKEYAVDAGLSFIPKDEPAALVNFDSCCGLVKYKTTFFETASF